MLLVKALFVINLCAIEETMVESLSNFIDVLVFVLF